MVEDLLAHGRAHRALTELARWAHLRRTSIRAVWHILRTPPAPALPAWFTDQAHHRHRTPGPAARPELSALSRVATHTVHAMSEIGRSAHADAQAPHGGRLPNPYTDAHLIDTYLAIPAMELPSPTRYKPILARAMGADFPRP